MLRVNLSIGALILTCFTAMGSSVACGAADGEASAKPATPAQTVDAKTTAGADQLTRLDKKHEVWIDRKNKTVIVGGQVCLREGALEMFACPKQTKEHESIVSVNSKAFIVHAGLLAVGAKTGEAAKFIPEYVPARGDEIEVEVAWKDQAGKQQKVRAQEWIREAGLDKSMEHPWVFVGSQFWTDPNTGRRYYQAEGGDMVCVSNFATAMMDLPIPSSQTNESLLFEAFTERIPPRGTKVKLLLRLKARQNSAKQGSSDPAEKPTSESSK